MHWVYSLAQSKCPHFEFIRFQSIRQFIASFYCFSLGFTDWLKTCVQLNKIQLEWYCEFLNRLWWFLCIRCCKPFVCWSGYSAELKNGDIHRNKLFLLFFSQKLWKFSFRTNKRAAKTTPGKKNKHSHKNHSQLIPFVIVCCVNSSFDSNCSKSGTSHKKPYQKK